LAEHGSIDLSQTDLIMSLAMLAPSHRRFLLGIGIIVGFLAAPREAFGQG